MKWYFSQKKVHINEKCVETQQTEIQFHVNLFNESVMVKCSTFKKHTVSGFVRTPRPPDEPRRPFAKETTAGESLGIHMFFIDFNNTPNSIAPYVGF